MNGMTMHYEPRENVVMVSDDGRHRVAHIVKKEADGTTVIETTHDSNPGDRLLVLVVTPALMNDESGTIFTATCYSYEVGTAPMMESLKPVRLVEPPSNLQLTEGVLWSKGAECETVSFVIHSYDEWSRTYTGELIRRRRLRDWSREGALAIDDGGVSRVYFPPATSILIVHATTTTPTTRTTMSEMRCSGSNGHCVFAFPADEPV